MTSSTLARQFAFAAALVVTLLATSGVQAAPKTLLILGDSLSAAYGIDERLGWVQLLRDTLDAQGEYRVVNASVSGETSRGGLARLPALLQSHQPDIVVVELGANDGLRGQPIQQLNANLTKIVTLSQAQGAEVLLLGMKIPPNYGKRYTQSFSAVYGKIAKKFELPLVDFFLDQVAGHRERMQADGIHPTADSQPQLLDNVLPQLQGLL